MLLYMDCNWFSSSSMPRSYLIRAGDGLHVHHCCVSIGLESQAYFMLDGSSHLFSVLACIVDLTIDS